VCDLSDREAAVAWAADQLRERNDAEGNPAMAFEEASLRFERIDQDTQGFWLRFGAENAIGQARSLYVRVHQQSCTYEAVESSSAEPEST